jgi:hypothetical protein
MKLLSTETGNDMRLLFILQLDKLKLFAALIVISA